jgi:hypothetical protein
LSRRSPRKQDNKSPRMQVILPSSDVLWCELMTSLLIFFEGGKVEKVYVLKLVGL